MPTIELVLWAALLLFLGWAAFVDAKKQMLPLEPLWAALAVALVWSVVPTSVGAGGLEGLRDAALGALFWLSWTGALWFFSQGKWMGYADLWLTAATGAALGVSASLEAWYFSYVVIGVLVAIVGLFKGLRRVAFAPMLFGGVLLAFLSGGRVLAWFAQALHG